MSTPDLEPEALARAIALRQLSMAPKTRAQLAQAMGRRGVPQDLAALVLDRLEEVDLVDDQAFAQQWVTSRHAGRGLARRALGHELRRRGVDEPLVREALELVSTDDEVEAAAALVRRRLDQIGPVTAESRDRVVRRLCALLARKGYGPGVAAVVVRRALELRGLEGGPEFDEFE